MTLLGEATYQVQRRPGSYVNGAWVDDDPAPAPFAVVGSMQPADALSLEALPEGARASATHVLLCEDDQPALQTVDVAGQDRADLVSDGSREFLVSSEADWTMHVEGNPHRVYGLVEVADDER